MKGALDELRREGERESPWLENLWKKWGEREEETAPDHRNKTRDIKATGSRVGLNGNEKRDLGKRGCTQKNES